MPGRAIASAGNLPSTSTSLLFSAPRASRTQSRKACLRPMAARARFGAGRSAASSTKAPSARKSDSSSRSRGGAPAAADARRGRVVVAETEADDCYFRVRDDDRAAPTFYLNEARGEETPNVEWRVVALGRPALAWVLLRDVEPGEELLVAYDA
mmetsp:Transcript_2861/g.9632  ORF Transcript_2861/g.9632 Transcript_2861/m.9632 type:complete len:154 (+) Transcript_2861:244-705(+)